MTTPQGAAAVAELRSPATLYFSSFPSPLGDLTLQGDGEFVTGLYLPNHRHWSGVPARAQRNDAAFAAAREQLKQYFAGDRQTFDVPWQFLGTPFQQRVWQALARIPFGETLTYRELATVVGAPQASRAVGSANGRNPISILVPCHRVIGSTGQLTGYGGGLEKKQWLLAWERTVAARR